MRPGSRIRKINTRISTYHDGLMAMTGIEAQIRKLQQSIRAQKQPALQDTTGKTARCTRCGDTGIISSGDVAWICSCQRQALRLQQQEKMAPELRDCSFEGFRADYYDGRHRERALAAQLAARQFSHDYILKRSSQGIMLTGDVGAGKTYLAAAIANDLLAQGVLAQFLVVPEFLDELRAALLHNNGYSHEADDVALLGSIRQVDVLVLDDLGAHNYTPWTCNKLYSLLNYRLNYQLPVIITTNLKMSELDEYLGERTTSRIVQMCRIYRLTVTKDIRHLKSQAKVKQVE